MTPSQWVSPLRARSSLVCEAQGVDLEGTPHSGQGFKESARLQYVSEKVDKELNKIENSKLQDLGKTREHYENLAENLTKDVAEQGN